MASPRAAPTLVESEAGFMGRVTEWAQLRGWKVAHFRPAKTRHGWRTPVQADGKGHPDLLLVRPPRVVYAEVKRDAMTPLARHRQFSVEQLDWLDRLMACPAVEVYVWRPADWDDVVRVLA